jgi:16S rRNA (adenine1518-N6/adenine1519-N6)-dimethyltransferase
LQVKAWCLQRDFHPNRTLGQNFLIDRNVLFALLDAADVRPGGRVLEVGPGLGVVTQALLDRGAEVVAVEKDVRLAAWLRESMGGEPRLELLEADLLDLDLDVLLARRFDRFVSNLPYSSGTRILIDVALHPLAPPRFTVTTQQEVAVRLAAGPGGAERCLAGVWLQRLYDVAPVRTVRATCFWPRPGVASAIVTLVRHDRHPLAPAVAEGFRAVTRQAFLHRRKQLGAVFRRTPPDAACPGGIAAALAACGIDPRARAEELTLHQWCALAARIGDARHASCAGDDFPPDAPAA